MITCKLKQKIHICRCFISHLSQWQVSNRRIIKTNVHSGLSSLQEFQVVHNFKQCKDFLLHLPVDWVTVFQ